MRDTSRDLRDRNLVSSCPFGIHVRLGRPYTSRARALSAHLKQQAKDCHHARVSHLAISCRECFGCRDKRAGRVKDSAKSSWLPTIERLTHGALLTSPDSSRVNHSTDWKQTHVIGRELKKREAVVKHCSQEGQLRRLHAGRVLHVERCLRVHQHPLNRDGDLCRLRSGTEKELTGPSVAVPVAASTTVTVKSPRERDKHQLPWHCKALCVDRVTERRQHLRAHHATTRRPIHIPTSAMVRLKPGVRSLPDAHLPVFHLPKHKEAEGHDPTTTTTTQSTARSNTWARQRLFRQKIHHHASTNHSKGRVTQVHSPQGRGRKKPHESHHRADLLPDRISVLCVRTGCVRFTIQTSIMIVCTLLRVYQPRIIRWITQHLILDTVRSARRHTVKDNHGDPEQHREVVTRIRIAGFLPERSKQGTSRNGMESEKLSQRERRSR